MLRRDFLQAVAAFAAAAATGGAKSGFTPPAGPATPEPLVWTPPAPGLVSTVGRLDIELVRGDEFDIRIDSWKAPVTRAAICADGDGYAALDIAIQAVVSVCYNDLPRCPYTSRVRFPASETAKLKPGLKMWAVRFGDGPNTGSIIGKATVLPDVLWKSQDEILGWLPKMHALGVERPRVAGAHSSAWFRERLRPDERSPEDSRVSSLIGSSRPVGAEIINRGQGCIIDFAREELL